MKQISHCLCCLSLLVPLLVLLTSCTTLVSGKRIGEMPTKEDCLGMIAVLPTFQSESMRAYYENNPKTVAREFLGKLKSVADGDDKDAQFTYGTLLLTGYCVPRDLCTGLRYLEKSKGGPNHWEQTYPMRWWSKEEESKCNEIGGGTASRLE